MRALSRLTACALLALSSAGCPTDFERQSQITHLRLVGVQAEPPELVIAPDGGLPATTLTALAIEPSGAPITTRFSLCLQQGVVPQPDIACPGDAGLDLPDGGPLAARLDLNDPAVQAVALAFLATYDGGTQGAGDGGLDALLAQGLPVLYGLELRAKAFGNPDGGPPPSPGFDVQRLIGLGTVTLRSASASLPPNHNPQLKGVAVDGAELNADGSSTVAAGTHTLLPIPADDAKEPTANGPEKLNFTFYATDGDIDSLRSDDTTATGQPGITSVDYTTPSAPGPVRLWVVIRDGRGGTGWLERSFTVTP
jgi:hypothetical protein